MWNPAYRVHRAAILLFLVSGLSAAVSSAENLPPAEESERVLDLNRTVATLLEERAFDEAIPLLHQALKIAKETGSFEGEAGALLNFGTYYEYRGLPDSTIFYLEEYLERFIDSDVAINMGNTLGTAYLSAGFYQKGLETYLKMLDLAEETGEDRMKLGITINLGNSYRSLGDLPLAIDSFLDVLSQAEEQQDTLVIALALNNLASINTHQQNYELSREYLQRALELNIASGNVRNQLTNHISLGVLYRELQNFEETFRNFQDALQLATDFEILLPQTQILYNLGTLYLAFDRLDQARDYFEESLKLSRENNYRSGIYFNEYHLGRVYEKMGDYPHALELYRSALQHSEESGSMEHIQQTLESLYTLSAATGDTASAFSYLQRFSTNSDSLIQAGREEALARQEAALGFRLEQENRMALETAYRNEHRNFLIVVGLLILLILLLAVTAWFYKKKRDINELLRNRTEELTRVNHLKNNLLSVLAHDLRAPLSNLKGMVFLIRNQALEGEDIIKTLEDIDNKLHQGIRTLTNYLQWAQSQWDGLEVTLKPLNIHQEIESILAEIVPLAQLKEITILNKTDPNLAVKADTHLLSVIFRNLLSNAIKFTHREGLILLESEKYKNLVNISITDNGIGIPSERLKYLFEPKTYTTEGTGGEQGTGLGLSICKDFAKKQNGTLSVHSVYGEGSTFTLQLENALAQTSSSRQMTLSAMESY